MPRMAEQVLAGVTLDGPILFVSQRLQCQWLRQHVPGQHAALDGPLGRLRSFLLKQVVKLFNGPGKELAPLI